MSIPKFIEEKEYELLTQPFDKAGKPTIVTSILATLLSNEPLKKEIIFCKIGPQHTGNSRGYMSNHFSKLSKLGIIKFEKLNRTWRPGIRYKEYVGFIFMEMIKYNEQAVESLKYKLMPKRDEQSVDFITSPTEDIFSKPNPFLD